MHELTAGATTALREATTVEDSLRGFVQWHVEYHAENRFKAKVTDDQLTGLAPSQLDAIMRSRDAYERLLKDLLMRGAAEAQWHVPDPSVLTQGVLTLCTNVGVWYREDGRLTPSQIADVYADFIIAGFAYGSGARPSWSFGAAAAGDS